jgi:hypothetical protein
VEFALVHVPRRRARRDELRFHDRCEWQHEFVNREVRGMFGVAVLIRQYASTCCSKKVPAPPLAAGLETRRLLNGWSTQI